MTRLARGVERDGQGFIDTTRTLQTAIQRVGLNPDRPLGGFLTARVLSAHASEIEMEWHSKGEKPWNYYGTGIEGYGKEFRNVLGGQSFQAIIDERRERFGVVYAMDLMGDGTVLQDLNGITGGISVTLTDGRSPDRRIADQEKGVVMVDGSVYDGQTWGKVSTYRKDAMAGKGFDLVISSPKGGWYWDAGGEHFIRSVNVDIVAQKVWGNLDENGGVAFMRLPNEYFAFNWIRRLREEGIVDRNSLDGEYLKLVRTPESPKKLPRIEGKSVVEISEEPKIRPQLVQMAEYSVGG